MTREAGKGDAPRPIEDKEQFDKNWERIFGKKCPEGMCDNRKQCREPCGVLGHDLEHARVLSQPIKIEVSNEAN